jgi:hypothetical protein
MLEQVQLTFFTASSVEQIRTQRFSVAVPSAGFRQRPLGVAKLLLEPDADVRLHTVLHRTAQKKVTGNGHYGIVLLLAAYSTMLLISVAE